MSEHILDQTALAALTGRTIPDVDSALKGWKLPTLAYYEIGADAGRRIATEVDRVIREEPLRRSGDDDPAVWVRGWDEVAARLRDQSLTEETLRPQYFRGEPTCRYAGRYIRPLRPDFEYDAGLALRRIHFDEFAGGYRSVVEFGCGTGINLFLLAARFPEITLIGADWAPACTEILADMARQMSRPISGKVFNMLTASGWDGDAIDGKTLCLTVHSMEQLGTKWKPFADFLAARRPGLCLHIEPIYELYDEASPFDALARRYHMKRGYLLGFQPYILALCRAGRGELVASRRVPFGGLYHEAYSVLAWRPLG